MKPILIIKTGKTFPAIAEKFGDFDDWIIAGMGLPEEHVTIAAPFLSQPLPAVSEISGVIITGSHAMVSDAEPWSVTTAHWLRKLAETSIPVLGICYGHQLLAEAFGGTVDFHPGGREIGTVEITTAAAAKSDPLFRELPETLHVHVAHAQSVIKLPRRATLLAKNNFETHHAFVIDNHIWGLQFHPEFNTEITKAYILELESDLQKEGFNISPLLASLKPSYYGATLLRRFVEICSQTSDQLKTPQ